MGKTKTFCEQCKKDVSFYLDKTKMDGNIKGEVYSYIGQIAKCVNCGAEIYVPKVKDDNLKALCHEYRQKNELISLELILDIPEKYSIGKRPLSLLLGWGEQTFSRYCDGDIPTKQYSDMLQKIYNEPVYFSTVLESNKDNLKSTASYEKSRRAVDILMGNVHDRKSKMELAIEYIMDQCEDITPKALEKSLYYIQGFYYAFYKTCLFSEDCEAMVHGPGYKTICNKYRDYRFSAVQKNTEFDCSVFSSAEKAILDSVIKNICCYSGDTLEKFTNYELPWLLTRGELSVDTPSDRFIKKELIETYFIDVKEKYNMINPNDIKEYTKTMFEQL